MRRLPFLLIAAAFVFAAGFAAMYATDRSPITAARRGELGPVSEGPPEVTAGTPTRPSSSTEINQVDPFDGAAPHVDEPLGVYSGIQDYRVLPDVRGIRLGMRLEDAHSVLRRQFPNAPLHVHSLPGLRILRPSPTIALGVNTEDGWTASSADPKDIIVVDVTAPPNAQVVWSVNRMVSHRPTDREMFLVALRQKYGQETFAFDHASNLATDSESIKEVWWLFDEEGQRAPMPVAARAAVKDGCGWSNSTANYDGNPQRLLNLATGMRGRTYDKLSRWCLSAGVAVHVTFLTMRSGNVTTTLTHMYDIPLAHRSDTVTVAWWRDTVRKLEEQAIERSNRTRPAL